jgi:hypothetical protein
MNKKFGSLLIAVFLTMQTFSLLHISKYSLESHEHGGKKCDICLNKNHNKLLGCSSPKLVSPNLLVLEFTPSKEISTFSSKAQIFKARAPPYFS